jgi:DNA polymerase bacteriophage-type
MDNKIAFLSGTNLTPPNPPRATIDFEGRSACDIMKQGAWIYSEHPSTQVTCLGIRLPHWPEARLWAAPIKYSWGIQDTLDPEALAELFIWISRGGLVEAHNAFFERAMWRNICVARMGWPEVPETSWRCSAAKASMHSLPRSLGAACAALDLPIQKDGEGRRVMLKLCKPRKPRKPELLLLEALAKAKADMELARELEIEEQLRSSGWDGQYFWHDDPEDLKILFAYCCTDVDSEHGLSEALPDLPEGELRIWQMDQAMNLRGVLSDVKLAKAALRLVDKVAAQMTRELASITGIEGLKASQRAVIKAWLAEQGVALADTTGATLDEWLAKEDFKKNKPHCHRVVRIVREVNRTSTAKYTAVLQMAAIDNRIRDLMMYHGASTGRWSGKGLQPHNFPRGSIKDMEFAVQVLMTEDIELIRMLYGEVIEVLSGALRGVLVASEGRDFMVADYAAIEARVIAWLAHANAALEVFRSGKCIYMDMATEIYGYPVTDKKKQADERQMGKQAILGLGFGMGFVTFLFTCHKYGIRFSKQQVRKIVGTRWRDIEDYMERYFFPERFCEDKDITSAKRNGKTRRNRIEGKGLVLAEVIHELILMKHIVDAYRRKYPTIVQMWEDVEAAAVAAVRAPGRRVFSKLGRCTFVVERRFLKCYLPSGRALYYCDPRLVNRKTPWGG